MSGIVHTPWRQGRRNGRNLYVQFGPEPSDVDPCIGMVDSPALAAHIVEAHNATLDSGNFGPGQPRRRILTNPVDKPTGCG